ncbi:hypothetical protein H696_05338 [Fonticula alba]|uniref:BAR domain-containing protein n=1 Tax=Fonticula alba TaxID=691883 RepID=A0A058Z1T4_FONAL|nr:hypothetical protein H696_05338 [Fonticula alba]KCV68086.1 hypothetical protein H696_05338 [Fonticula alba]|eukprot:XP_009497460.1 hypothetical protein H696_05338 [Fonticula alba]
MSDSSAPTYDPMLDQPAAAAAAAPAAEAQHSEPMDPVGMAGSAVNTAAEVVGGISGTLVGGVQAAWGALNPLARRLNTGFHIAKQITTETIGVTRATEFSEQYRHLETNVRRLERAHSLLIRSVNQISGPTPLVPVKRVIGGISSLLDGSNAQATSAPAETSNAQHAKAVAAQFSHVAGVLLGTAPISQTQATLSLSPETPMPDSAIDKGARAMAQACQHLASIQESFGTAHAKLNAEIINQVVAPLQDSLELITSALNTCRTAVNARLELDAVKSRVNPNRASSEESRVDLDMAQLGC